MKNHFYILVPGLFAALFSDTASAIYLGTGFSTVTDGRTVPALQLGVDIGNVTVSGMLAGVQTAAYYSSAYQLNLMWSDNWGKFWGGHLGVAFGGGLYYGQKGIYQSLDAEGKGQDLSSQDDLQIGPSFRVSYRPIGPLYFSVEYMFGLNEGLLSLGVANMGMGAIGMEF